MITKKNYNSFLPIGNQNLSFFFHILTYNVKNNELLNSYAFNVYVQLTPDENTCKHIKLYQRYYNVVSFSSH